MKKDYSVNVTAQHVYRKKLFAKVAKIVFLFLIVIISIAYLILYIINDAGNFTVSLDKNMANRKNVYLSEDGKTKSLRLSAQSIDYMDNISIHWIPEDVDTEKDGSHNGNNYIAYSFYAINSGKETVHYWYQMEIDDTIKNVDTAIRIMIYQNGTPTVYAKENGKTKQPEEGTKAFYSNNIAVLEQRKDFKPGEKDRYTVVVWIEGDDPDCTNDLLGGEIKLQMNFTEEHTDSKK